MKIYVASEYGRKHGLKGMELTVNVKRAIEAGRNLISMGHFPFIANLYHYVHEGWMDSPDENTYFKIVSSWIENCDAVFVASIPKWKNSGVHREIEIAKKLGIPVFYHLEDIKID